MIYICTAFTDLDNMDIRPFISQHEIHVKINNTKQNRDEDNQGNIGRDIHNGVIPNNILLTEVEAQQEGQGWPEPVQCSK